jgi:UDP-glucose 4-epimerase
MSQFTGKTLLITGGTGSFGHAVVSRFLHKNLDEIRILSRDEKKQEDMRILLANDNVKFYIGDVRNYKSVKDAMNGVDYVFHAAALKQVPSCEFYPMEAVHTNILGAENVLNAAADNKVKMVIVLSTDKAVYPINAMGISKAMMEKVMVAKSRMFKDCGTIMCGTRYGNVMASRGSVIPLFIKQIQEGKSLTVTDPGMTRFLMSLDSAVDLVLYAFENAKPGDIFVKKAPGATIGDLAKAMLHMMGSDNPIKIIGTRHGEKLYETLLTREEMIKAEDCGDYYRVRPDDRGLNYNLYFSEGKQQISVQEDYHSHNAQRLNMDQIKELLENERIIQDILEGLEIK